MAIIIERTITIKDDKATLDRPLYLYIGDGDITCLFTIEEKKKAATFGSINKTNTITENASYGEVRIYKPDKGSDATSRLVFTDRAEIIDDKLQVIFSYKNIDDFSEAGVHKLQIHLYDDDDSERNRFTIPPIDINVLLPVGYDNNATDEAIVGYSLLDARGEEVPTFDEEGNYNVTVWETGDIITKDKLNKLEDALYQVTAADDNFVTNEVLEAELANKADEGHNHNSLYATKAELNNKANANHSHTNYAATNHSHSGYASSNHTHNEYATTSQLRDHSHSGYALTGHNHDGAYLTQSALSNYATKSYVDNSGFLTSIPAAYVTEGELENYLATKTYATTAYVQTEIRNAGGFSSGGGGDNGYDHSQLATKIELDAKADKTHTHDNYLTTATLDGYASKAYVDDAVAKIGIDPSVLAEYAKIENVPTKVTDLDDGIYYATKEDVDEAIAEIGIANHTHGELTSVTGDTIGFSGTVGLLPSKSDVFDLGHMGNKWKMLHVTSIQCYKSVRSDESIYSPFVMVDEVKFNDGTVITGCGEEVEISLSDFAKKTDLEDYITESEVNTKVSELDNKITNNYATKSELPTNVSELENDKGYITSNAITGIEVVEALPPVDQQKQGVLYIVKA